MFDSLHARLRESLLFQRVTAMCRVLLAVGFIPPGITKMIGHPFTLLPPSTPVGYFFDAFFQASEYYAFVGFVQVLAGVLLLFPRTATVGAALFFPIILNITMITLSIGFEGTWLVTLLMLAANVYLLVWDYQRLKTLLPNKLVRNGIFGSYEYVKQAGFWAMMGLVAYGFVAMLGVANLWSRLGLGGFVMFAMAGVVFGSIIAWHLQRMPGSDEAVA